MMVFLFSGPPTLILVLAVVTALLRGRRERALLAQMRPCPLCLTLVPRAALICRQCRSPLPAPPVVERGRRDGQETQKDEDEQWSLRAVSVVFVLLLALLIGSAVSAHLAPHLSP